MRLVLVMPTGLQVGYDAYFSSSPLGLETIAAHVRDLADVVLADLRGKGHDVESHAEELLKDEPDMIGVSVNSAPHTKYTLALAAAVKRRRPEVRIVLGGQQATFLTDEMMAPGHVDAVVRGEGELTLREIVLHDGFQGVQGVSWRAKGTVHHEGDRPQIANMDDVLPPARDLLADRQRYRVGKYRVEGIETSRGCTHQCSFCSVRNFHRGKWRPKSVQRVMREVDDLLDRCRYPKVIYFVDDNFSTDIRRVEQICRAIVERNDPDTYFWCQARVDMLAKHPEVVEWMGKARFTAVLLGLETPVARLLKSSGKNITVEQTTKTIELLHAQDIGAWGTFTMGLPGETLEDAEAVAKFIPAVGVDVAQITVATPIPGSTLYDDAKAQGDLLVTDWDQYDFTSPTMRGQLPKKKLESLMHGAYLKVYLSRRFLRSMFTQRTNLHRLRRTMFGVFWSWIWFLVKEQARVWLGLRRKSPHPHRRTDAAVEMVPEPK
jgi:anaerobic magnesium-protoporphyrin IX monomethyl ester cyclase